MRFAFRVGAATDVGQKRTINQDSWATTDQLAVVADGMGGHRGGEVASAIAVQEVLNSFAQSDLGTLVAGVERANALILDTADANPDLHGMGTTVVALAMVDVDEERALAAINVGDSRMYRAERSTVEGGEDTYVLQQLTQDHSLVAALVREGRITAEEAHEHPQRNIVTRALGVSRLVEVDDFQFVPRLGDRYLLASDGLFDELGPDRILELVVSDPDPGEVASRLTAEANAMGGRDNITVVVVDIVEPAAASLPQVTTMLASQTQAETVVLPVVENQEAAAEGLDVPESGRRNRWSWRR